MASDARRDRSRVLQQRRRALGLFGWFCVLASLALWLMERAPAPSESNSRLELPLPDLQGYASPRQRQALRTDGQPAAAAPEVGAALARIAPSAAAPQATATQRTIVPVLPPKGLRLSSSVALVTDIRSGDVLLAKNAETPTPIASITKLMTAMVVLDGGLPLDEQITVIGEDVDHLRGSHSRVRVGSTLSRGELLQLALMSSDNRAAAALARTYPGGAAALVAAAKRKAARLGMTHTRLTEPTGLAADNVSTAADLARMVQAACEYPLIRRFTTARSLRVRLKPGAAPVEFRNTNMLVRAGKWEIGLSKTGYVSESGRCLVMQAVVAGRTVIMVLLDAQGKYSGVGDANRIRQWLGPAIATHHPFS